MDNYPNEIPKDIGGMHTALTFISRERKKDIIEFNNLVNIHPVGRSVGRIPSSSTNVIAGDRLGDQNITKDYIYTLCSDGAGGAVWRRLAQVTW